MAPTTVTVPDSPEGLQELLNDKNAIKNLFQDPEQFKSFVTQYAENVGKADADLGQRIKEETQLALAEFVKDQGGDEKAAKRLSLQMSPEASVPTLSQQKASLYNPKAMGASLDDEFDTPGEFFKTIWHQTDKTPEVRDQLNRLRNAFGSDVPSEGGYLIPERLRAELLRVSLETSIVRPRARVIPMDSLRVPFPSIDSTSNVNSVYGGIVAFWTEEGAELTASQAKFGRTVLDAKKLTIYTEAPNELISDSIVSFDSFISEIFPEAMGFYEDDAFLTEDGVGKPLGVLHDSVNAAVNVTRTGNGDDGTLGIGSADIVNMYSRMLPRSLNRAVWVASIDTFPQLAQLTVGNSAVASWLTGGQLIQGPPMTLLGRPVIFTEKSPTLDSTGDLAFVDFGFYLVGDRQTMSARSSEHYKFQNDMTAYRILERVDGRPWLNSSITPRNGGSALSPIVKLAAGSGA